MGGTRSKPRTCLAASAIAAALACAPAAAAAERTLLEETVRAAGGTDRSCLTRSTDGAGVATRMATAPAPGWIAARLGGARGDWDVAVHGAGGRLVAGSAALGAVEVAQGVVAGGERLVVRLCRRPGASGAARLSLSSVAVRAAGAPARISLVRVSTPSAARKRLLTRLGLDLTEHAGRGFVEVVLHGARDARLLRENGFMYVLRIGDLLRAGARDRAADRRYARDVQASALPSRRTTYRRLPDYEQEMKALARDNPDLVRAIALPYRTYEGRTVQGIEVTTNPRARDGKPSFVQLGVHHAREWPSSEHVMEWAYELVRGYRAGNARVRRLVRSTRAIIVPVVNPDGFNRSREAGEAQGAGGGRPSDGSTLDFILSGALHPNEFRRKNCRLADDSAAGDCAQPSNGMFEAGVDLNRNYGGFWGGPGSSTIRNTQTYRGPGPFSEPETRDVQWLLSRRQATTLLTNHTFANLVLRPPGVRAVGAPVDEPALKALGDAMARANGYTSGPGYDLYDVSGATEDWSYYATGGFGYTIEIGLNGFHPPFADVVAEYEGTTAAAGNRGGNREAYFLAQESTANAARHSVIRGRAPAGAVLRLSKRFQTLTAPVVDANGSEGPALQIADRLDTVLDVPRNGRYEWHVNPSTRPIVAQARGRPARGNPSAPQTFAPTRVTIPCAVIVIPACAEDVLVTVPRGAGIDNARATIAVSWASALNDYDVEVYRADAGGQAVGTPVATAGTGGTTTETVTLSDAEIETGNRYVVRVINFLALSASDQWHGRVTFAGPPPFAASRTERWTVTCETRAGRVLSSGSLAIERGRARRLDFRVCASRLARLRCDRPNGRVRGAALDRAALGRTRARNRRAYRSPRRSSRSVDRWCLRDGGSVRAGYAGWSTGARAVAILTTSRAFRLRGVRVGTGRNALGRRIGRVRPVLIGRRAWFAVPGGRATLLYAVRRGRVEELGLGDARLAGTAAGLSRLLRSLR